MSLLATILPADDPGHAGLDAGQLGQLAGMVVFYLFGDRTYTAIRGGK